MSRQHFLKINLPKTYQTLSELDIKEDYSMGYADHLGFRASVSSPFYFYNLDIEKQTFVNVNVITGKSFLKIEKRQRSKILILVIKNLINSTRGKYVFSILLGLGLASLFRKSCQHRNCMIFKAPHINKISNDVFKHDGKCYKYNHEPVKCASNKKIIEFQDKNAEKNA